MKVETPLSKTLFSILRLEVTTPQTAGVTTAFVFSQSWQGAHAPFLVTAAHVLEGATKGRIFFCKGKDEKPVIGEYVCLELEEFSKGWHRHPNKDLDVAILPLAPLVRQIEQNGGTVFNTALDESLLPGADPAVDAVEDVHVLGFSAEVQDRRHLFPLVQKGVTANPYVIDYAGTPKFAVQVPVYAGMAGSPVLLARTFHQPTSQGMATATQLVLLGMLTEVAVRQDRAASINLPIPTLPSPGREDLTWCPFGLALKSSAISEAVLDFLKTLEATQPQPVGGTTAPQS